MTVAPHGPLLEPKTIDEAVAALRERGVRVTSARRLVLEGLFAADRPVSAEHIASGDGALPPSDLASVYRNLEALERLGLVRHVHSGHGAGLYAHSGLGDREYLVCERCGDIRSVAAAELDHVRSLLRDQYGFEARFSHFPIAGLCARCAESAERSWGLPGYHDVRSYPDAEQLAGLVVFRFDAPIFFANARTFREQIRELASADPPPSWIVVAAEPITDVDTTAADMLEELDEAINAKGVSLVFAEMKDPVKRKIERYELTRTIDPRHFFPTVGAAIAAYQEKTGIDWARPPHDGAVVEPP